MAAIDIEEEIWSCDVVFDGIGDVAFVWQTFEAGAPTPDVAEIVVRRSSAFWRGADGSIERIGPIGREAAAVLRKAGRAVCAFMVGPEIVDADERPVRFEA